ncbi:MAG: hypothetical protein JNL82_40575 [Myxococcales bacterium]|nr:hypothetical protein [Myxococcales bacterium]
MSNNILQRLEALFGQVQTIDTRVFEGAPVAEILTHAVPPLREAADAALALLREVRALYPDDSDPLIASSETSGAFNFQLDEVMQIDNSRRRIADVVVLGMLELAGKRNTLAALGPAADPWGLIDVCAGTRRRLLKVLSALRQAIGSHHGVPTVCAWYRSELELSLAGRNLYTQFRRSVARIPEPGPADVRRRLREAGTLLAMLIGKDIYEYVRTSDRRQIRAIQERVLAWLRAREGAPRAGIRIFQDFVALVGLFVQINLRAELREHDLTLARALAPRLAAAGPQPPVARAELLPLFGRDDELDDLLASDEALPPAAVRNALVRITASLDGDQPAPDGHDALL